MDKEKIDQFRDLFKEIKEAEELLYKAEEPFRLAGRAIQTVKDALMEAAEVEGEMMTCEFCSTPLFEGDQGHHFKEEGVVCAECAPDFADLKKQSEEILADPNACDDAKSDAQDTLAFVSDHIDNGGAIEDKVLHTL